MNLLEIFKAVKKRFSILLMFLIGAAIIGAGISTVLNKKYYESTATMTVGIEDLRDTEELNKINGEPIQEKYIKYGTNNLSNENFQFYKEILRSDELLDDLIDSFNLDLNRKKLEENIILKNPEGTGTLLLTIRSEDNKQIDEIVNHVIEKFKVINTEITDLDNIKVLKQATTPQKMNSQNILINSLILVVVGSILGVIIIIILEYLEKQ